MPLNNKKNLISFIKLARTGASRRYYVEFYDDFTWSVTSTRRKDLTGSTVAQVNLYSLGDHGWFNFGLHITILINLWAIERLIIASNNDRG